MKLRASGEDYLETILVLHKKTGMVHSVDVARHMGVSKPSVCVAVNTLKDGGFLTMDEDHFLHLTDVGREVAEKIYNLSNEVSGAIQCFWHLFCGFFVNLIKKSLTICLWQNR